MNKRYLHLGAIMATLAVFFGVFAYVRIKNTPDVPYVPTSPKIVKAMLELAQVGETDVVYDLGSGDGRIVVAAVKNFGARRGVGVDIDAKLVGEAVENAKKAGVAEKTRFVEGDLFEQDFSEATVVTMYLLPEINLRLRPKILALKPGTRVVSHRFDMGDWQPEKTVEIEGRKIYLWRVPAND
jgi:SAM-dependent methyltransferase